MFKPVKILQLDSKLHETQISRSHAYPCNMKDSMNLNELTSTCRFTAIGRSGVQLQDQVKISARFEFKSQNLLDDQSIQYMALAGLHLDPHVGKAKILIVFLSSILLIYIYII